MLEFILQEILAYTLIEVTEILAMIVFLSNLVSIWLPNHSKYKWVQWLLDTLNTLSLNIAKNANRLYHSLEHRAESQQREIDQAVEQAVEKVVKRHERRVGGSKP